MSPNLAELRALLEAATPGPWEYGEAGSAFAFCGPEGDRVMSASDHWSTNPPSEADAALIVAMHAALPDLLTAVELLRAIVEDPDWDAPDTPKARATLQAAESLLGIEGAAEMFDRLVGVPDPLVEPTE